MKILALLCSLTSASLALGQVSPSDATRTNNPYPIDLVTVLKLAHARNLDIQIAKDRLAEAEANRESADWQFFPSFSPGVSYRRHDNLIQDVGGSILDVHKQSYAVGPTVTAQIELGTVIYSNLVSRQLVRVADHALETQLQDTVLIATGAYFDLLKARAAVSIANEGVNILTNYLDQVQRAAEAGIAFEGDVLRVQGQTERNRLTLRQAEEQAQSVSAHLAEVLRLQSVSELTPNAAELAPMILITTNSSLDSLVAQAFSSRPELNQSRAVIQAARYSRKGVVYGPLIPSLGVQVFAGGLGGGRDGTADTFGQSEDYQVTLGWRIGPGGLFDTSRIRATEARLKIADANGQKLVDAITREVVQSHARFQSLTDQILIARRAVQAAEKTLQLSEARKQFAVGSVLETILAEQELTHARLDLSNTSAEFNKAQYALQRAIGKFDPFGQPPPQPREPSQAR